MIGEPARFSAPAELREVSIAWMLATCPDSVPSYYREILRAQICPATLIQAIGRGVSEEKNIRGPAPPLLEQSHLLLGPSPDALVWQNVKHIASPLVWQFANMRDHLGRIVRGTVEETLNAMLEAEADRLCNAGRYERTQAQRDQCSGSCDRKLQTKAGEVRLRGPKLRRQAFETAIIERYRRREGSAD